MYTIVHEHFEEIFHQKAPKYGRSLIVLNSYRRVIEAERGFRESRLWIFALISAIASGASAFVAVFVAVIAVWK